MFHKTPFLSKNRITCFEKDGKDELVTTGKHYFVLDFLTRYGIMVKEAGILQGGSQT